MSLGALNATVGVLPWTLERLKGGRVYPLEHKKATADVCLNIFFKGGAKGVFYWHLEFMEFSYWQKGRADVSVVI